MVIGMLGLLNQTPQNVYNPNPIVQKVSVPKTPTVKPVESLTKTAVVNSDLPAVKENKSGKISGFLKGWITAGMIGLAMSGNPYGASELGKILGYDLFPAKNPIKRGNHLGACTSYNHVCPPPIAK